MVVTRFFYNSLMGCARFVVGLRLGICWDCGGFGVMLVGV